MPNPILIKAALLAADKRTWKGAAVAIKFKKNADKVSSFCNDVIGDICGVISGSAGSMIALSLSSYLHCNRFLVVLFVMATVSALTIGGKAIGKSIAMNQSNEILYKFAKIISFFGVKK